MRSLFPLVAVALLSACSTASDEAGTDPEARGGRGGAGGNAGAGATSKAGGGGSGLGGSAAGAGGASQSGAGQAGISAHAGAAGTAAGGGGSNGGAGGSAGGSGQAGGAGDKIVAGGSGGASGAGGAKTGGSAGTAGTGGVGGAEGISGTGGVSGASGNGAAAGAGPAPLPYPTRTAMRVKGLQPDFHANKDEVSGNNTGGVAMNLLWAGWEPAPKQAPCGANEEEYDGRCFVVDGPVDAAIADWTARGLVVTAVAYGSPAWSRTKHLCSPQAPGFDIFCTPDDMADYARFMGMIARRYDGHHGHGRLADFVVWNEVNHNDWFDIGCGQGTPCDKNAWIEAYAAMYRAAYDAVLAAQPHAKVLASLEHHFGNEFENLTADHPLIGAKSIIDGLAARVGDRAFRVAYHPYPPNLLKPEFSPDDYPRITYGNVGAIVGYLRATFPSTPSSWEVQLTESGISSGQSSQAAQSEGVCSSLRNVVGTPGIESYIYHRMHDHPDETKLGLAVGLWDDKGPKQAWATWALANRDDLSPKQLSCGFEDLPYVRLRRSLHATRGHWSSTRVAPAGFVEESSYRLHHDPQPQSHLLFECKIGQHTFLSPAAGCEGQLPMGPVGYAWDSGGEGRVELFRCAIGGGADHFVTTDAGCEGKTNEQSLGFVLP